MSVQMNELGKTPYFVQDSFNLVGGSMMGSVVNTNVLKVCANPD